MDWRNTEKRSPRYQELASWPRADVLSALLDGQQRAIHSVHMALPEIERAVDAAVARLESGNGRIIYTGAGTSGRLGVLDGIELGPTFNWPDTRILNLFAGGDAGMKHAMEGAEDDIELAGRNSDDAGFTVDDVVIGIAASGTTPYTRAVIQRARAHGALTISLANNPGSPLLKDADIGVLLDTGAEVLAGSTRLSAGTSQKAALNLLSTCVMVGLNKVYGGYMVDMVVSNDKLGERAAKIVASVTGCSDDTARDALAVAGMDIKAAILQVSGHSPQEAAKMLDVDNGNLGAALKRSE